MSSFGGCVCEMWTTWICPPVAVPGQPPIRAGSQFLQGSPTRGPATGVQQEGPPTGWRAFSSKPVKWTIGRFYWLTRRTRSSMQLWGHGSDFTYTKNSAMGRSDCIYTKNSARPRWDFPYTKNGGEASENGDFQRRKQRLQGPIFTGAREDRDAFADSPFNR